MNVEKCKARFNISFALRKYSMRNLLENFLFLTKDFITVFNKKEPYIEAVNNRWCEVLGYTVEELLSRPFFEFIHPEDLSDVKKIFFFYSKTGKKIYKGEYYVRYQTKVGEYVILQWKSEIIDTGNHYYMVARLYEKHEEGEKKILEQNKKMKQLWSRINL